jgi:hypothetical protein
MFYYKEYVAVLSVLNLASDFVKCNHPIGFASESVQAHNW